MHDIIPSNNPPLCSTGRILTGLCCCNEALNAKFDQQSHSMFFCCRKQCQNCILQTSCYRKQHQNCILQTSYEHIGHVARMSASGYRGRRFEPRQHQYVVSLSKTLYPRCSSRLRYEMSTRWGQPLEGWSVL